MEEKRNLLIRSSAAEYLTFVAATGDDEQSVEMRYENENIWLTQKVLAALYDVEVHTVNEHITKIYKDSELEQSATIRNFRIVQTECNRQVEREIRHYNLQMIIAVGFKVNTDRAVLTDSGKISAEIAKTHAESEFEKYRVIQDRLLESYFDRLLSENEVQ